ncbi:MAG: hypothetical protein K8T20_13320 [Planctomycetes bacterium]|nr:hypothetical protein [Planctomycetota bacterium]
MKNLILLAGLAALLASCGKPAPPPATPAAPSPSANDTPILSRAKIFQWIAGEVEFRQLGFHSVSNPSTGPESAPAAGVVKEADDFARRYGFADYAEYDRVRRRIVLARLYVVKSRLRAQQEENLKQQIRIAKDVVTDGRATEENKKLWTANMMKALEDLQALPPLPPPDVPAGDVLVVQQYDAEISRAEMENNEPR